MSPISLMLSSAALAVQPTSQPPAPADTSGTASEPIIVEAPRTPLERRRELKKMAKQVIRPPRRQHPLGSFFKPVCPKVEGVPEGFARAMENRMRQNAKDLGIRVRKSPDCKRNIAVVFMPPEAGSPEQWLNQDSDVLDHLLSFQRQWVLEEEGPVRAWNETALRDYDGIPQKDRNGRDPLDPDTFNQVRQVSRLANTVTSEIVAAVVLIELESAKGKSVFQLADYASMRAYANIAAVPPDAPLAAPTILTLFQDDEPPQEMSDFDRALIAKLYSSPRNSWSNRVYSNIAARAVDTEMAAAPDGE